MIDNMKDQHIFLACRLGLVGMVLMTVYWLWTSLVFLLSVLVLALLTDRYLKSRFLVTLSPQGKTVLITGCDTGIGHETALAAADAGLTVIACCFDDNSPGANELREKSSKVQVLPLDVTDDESVEKVRSEVTRLCGEQGLWAVINNAGLNRVAPVELTSMATFQLLADVMLFGTVRVTRALLPLVRRAKGRIVTVSSDRGMMSPAYSAAYCITKHGVETFSDVLRAEMASFGVAVCIVQPGHFGGATAIINEKAIGAMRASMERDFAGATEDAQQVYGHGTIDKIISATDASRKTSKENVLPVVSAMLDAILNERPATRYPVHGSKTFLDWRIVLGQVKPVLPDHVADWLQRFFSGA